MVIMVNAVMVPEAPGPVAKLKSPISICLLKQVEMKPLNHLPQALNLCWWRKSVLSSPEDDLFLDKTRCGDG